MFDLHLFSVFSLFCLSDFLWMLLFVYARLPGVWSLLLRSSRVCRSSARQVTLWSYSSIPSFYYALVLPSNICMSRIENMWFVCSTWGRNLIPFLSLRDYICYALLYLVYKLIIVTRVPGYWHFEYMELDIIVDLITL